MTKTYTTKSNALRAAKSAGFTKEQVEILGADGAFYFKEIMVAVPVAPIGSQMEGDIHDYLCPHCGIHLSNGIGSHGQEVNNGVILHKEYEFCCLACEGEFGPAIKKVAVPTVKAAKKAPVEHTEESTVERPCKLTWAIADEMTKSNPEVKRKEVLEACVARGIAYNTARTQFQQWFQLNKSGK